MRQQSAGAYTALLMWGHLSAIAGLRFFEINRDNKPSREVQACREAQLATHAGRLGEHYSISLQNGLPALSRLAQDGLLDLSLVVLNINSFARYRTKSLEASMSSSTSPLDLDWIPLMWYQSEDYIGPGLSFDFGRNAIKYLLNE